MKLGLNLSFAVKRWLDPVELAKMIKEDFGVDHVQFTWDLIDPWWPQAQRDVMVYQYKDAFADAGITIDATFGGLASYSYAHLLAPTKVQRDIAFTFFKRAIDMTVDMGAKIMGTPVGGMDYHDARDPQRREELYQDMGLKEGDEIAVLVNGLGSTPLLELNLVFYELHKRMHKDGLKIYDTEIKTYCTCMEMGGFSITFLKLDDELKPYYDAPCYSPYYAKGSVSGEAIEDDGEDEEIEFDENDVKPAEIVRSKEGELTELNAEDTRNMLLYIADKIIANKPYLTEIDSAIGDGDHGIGMAGGMQKAKKKLLKMAGEENAYQLFETAGQAMLMSMGGASGVIFGSLYLAGAKGMDPKSVITSKDLADMEKKSLEAIQERGGAQVGDKTMVDALSPAVDALAANADKGLLEMLKAAEESAKQGVEDTKKYVAKFGRAKSLLERAIGHQDAGATSVYLIFQGMREFVEGKLA